MKFEDLFEAMHDAESYIKQLQTGVKLANERADRANERAEAHYRDLLRARADKEKALNALPAREKATKEALENAIKVLEMCGVNPILQREALEAYK